MEFEEVTLCQKYSQLSHLFEQCDASIPFKYWIPSFLLHMVGVAGGAIWLQHGNLTMLNRALELWALHSSRLGMNRWLFRYPVLASLQTKAAIQAAISLPILAKPWRKDGAVPRNWGHRFCRQTKQNSTSQNLDTQILYFLDVQAQTIETTQKRGRNIGLGSENPVALLALLLPGYVVLRKSPNFRWTLIQGHFSSLKVWPASCCYMWPYF